MAFHERSKQRILYEEDVWDGENWHSRQFNQTFYENQVRSFLEIQGYQVLLDYGKCEN